MCKTMHAQLSAPPDTTPFYQMTLEQLMNVNVTVASQSPMTSRHSPGIVTILNRDEIINTGASDIMGVLQQVPGFDFGVDVEGVVGIGVRGNWAHEGKVLLIVDGMEMNEDLYSTLQFGNHYPLDHIQKIEIIRGPGSAMYGGNAEYAVIKITTINNRDFNGVSAATHGSWMSDTYASRGVSVAAGHAIGIAHLNVSAIVSEANRSQEKFLDAYGGGYEMKDQSSISNGQYRMDFHAGNFSLTGLYEKYGVDQRDGYGAVYLRPYKVEFNSGHLSAKYEYKATEKLTITPGFKAKQQQPWAYTQPITDDNFTPFSTAVSKREYYVNASFNPNEQTDLKGGFVYYHQHAQQNFDTVYFSNLSQRLTLDNYAGFFQGIFKLKPVSIILGSRYEYNSIFGKSFVPRLGITKVKDGFHLKALYSRAFRAPSIENINLSPDILPEKTTVIEFEGGLKLSPNCYLTANLYDISTFDPIIYYYEEEDADLYVNESSTGSRGFDIDFKAKLPGWYATISYSFNSTSGHNVIPVYRVPGKEEKVLAFPSHELCINSNFQLSKRISISPMFTYLSERFSYLENEDGSTGAERIIPVLYANVNLNITDIFCKGLLLQAGCFNATDEKVLFIQPYKGNHRPLPGQGRQFQLKLRYTISFDRK